MNIYRVTNIDTHESYEATTEAILDKLFLTKDTLYWHAKTKSPYAGFVFEKIGTDGRGNRPRKPEPRNTKTNTSLEDDLRQARLAGMTYGKWKSMQSIRG